MIDIFKRELRSYFNSMTGYVFISALVCLNGVYFTAYNLYSGYPYYSYALMSMLSILMFTVPILTMKSMAEERKSRTDQLLLTAPVSLTAIVMGKYLAMITVLFIPTLVSCICPLIISAHGVGHLAADYASIFAFYLVGCVFIAIGMYVSSLTESQIIAAVGTFAIILILHLWDDLVNFTPKWMQGVLSAFSFRTAFSNFAQYQVFDLGGVFLYLSMAFIFIFLTIQTLQKRRIA